MLRYPIQSLQEDYRWNLFKPAAPTGVAGLAGNAQVALSWTAPATSVPPVTGYAIQYSSDSGSTWTTFADAVSTARATVTGLTNNTSYVFRVAAVNGIGTGSYSTASSSVTPVTDSLFSSVGLLLHFDGTGSTITDSSGTPKTVTGAATQSATQSKFGGKSLYLDGTTKLSSAYNSAWAFSGDFTIEYFVNYSAHGTYGGMLSCCQPSGATTGWQIIFNSSSNNILTEGSGWSFTSSSALPANQWNHVALVRSGSAITLYINGSSVGSATYSGSVDSGNQSLLIGTERGGAQYMTGYIDELRITSAARYTGSSFTVPTAVFPNS